ncbi:MAG: PAS domain S-box protein [Chitinophagaceae bacterium]|nr:MAG: PAS domain S-box protein [Chitinophagaceae bacterium]
MHNNSNKIFHSLPYPAILLKKQKEKFVVIDINKSFADTFSLELKDVYNKDFIEVVVNTACFGKDFDASDVFTELNESFKSNQSITSDIREYSIVRDQAANRDIYYINSVTIPLIETDEKREYLMHSLPDLSERGFKSTAEANFMFESGLESLFLINKNLNVVSTNKRDSEQFKLLFSGQVKRGDSILDLTPKERLTDLKKIFEKVFSGRPVEENITVKSPDGSERYLYLKYTPAKNNAGNIIGAVVSINDLTHFYSQEFDLMQSKIKTESIINSVNGIFWEAKADDFTFSYVSPQLKDILGYTQEEWYSSKTFWLDHIHPEDKSYALEYCMAQVKKGLDHKFEYRMISKAGKVVWLEDIVSVVSENGTPTIIRGVMIDITNQKKIEKENKDLVIKLNERVKEQACLYKISQLNSSKLSEKKLLEKALKILPEGFQNPAMTEVFIQYGNEHFKSENFKHAKSNLTKEGKTINGVELVVSISQTKGKKQNASFIEEEEELMTEAIIKNLILQLNQKITLNQVEKTNSQLKNIMDQSLDVICTIDGDGIFVSVSAATLAIWGYEPEELIGKNYMDFIDQADIDKTKIVAEKVTAGNDVTNFENIYIRKDGKRIPMIWSAKWHKKDKLMYCVARDGTEKKKAELALTERNKFIETTIHNLPIGISVNNIKDGKATFMNKNFCKIYGWPEEELSDVNTFFEKVYPDKAERNKIKKRILDDIKSRDLERMNWEGVTITTKEGKKKIITAKNIPLYEQNLMISTVLDITNQKKAEEELRKSESRFRGVIDSQTNYILRTDLEGNYTFYNDKFKEDFGWVHNNENLLGINCMESILPYHHERVAETVQKCFETPNKVFQVDIDKPAKDGGVKTTLWDFVCFTDSKNNPIEMQCAGIDITARKTAEDALLQKSRQLINLNKSLNEQALELENANKELEQFVYVASHDLQEPLRMVTSFLTKIEDKYNDKLDEKGRRYIHFAVSGAKNMRKLILDLLEYSRTGRIAEEPQKVDLNEIVENVLKIYADSIEAKNIKITKDTLPVISASKTSIYQLFKNLIGNAINYSANNRTPEIKITVSESKDEWLFSVRDNGIGIDPEFHEKIFDLFQRLHGSDEYSGSGLGLAICKKIVEFYGGNIKVDSKEGEGANFTFSINKRFAGNSLT